MNTNANNHRHLVMTEQDLDRLTRLVERNAKTRNARECEALAEEIERAHVVPSADIPADVVTMNSRVRFGVVGGEEMEATLVYPSDADAEQHRISVLAPIGAALLGLSVGAEIEWPLPGGAVRRLRVLDVPYQPEKAGDFHL